MRAAGWGVACGGAIVLLCALLVVAGRTTLWDRDEPRFAVATIEMVESGNYLYPTFNGALRPDKPILVYWLMSISARLFGAGEVALRAVAALGMALAALATYAAARWLFSPPTGLLAAGILVTTPLALIEGSAATTDALLLAETTLALAAFSHAFMRGWHLLHPVVLALAFGAALLTKGPVGLVIPLSGVALAWWWGRAHIALQPRHVAGVALATAVGVGLFLAWAIPANAATAGQLARGGVGHHILQRMVEPLEGHGGPLLLYLPYYLLVLLVGFFPWTLFLGGALSALASGRLGGSARALLLGWAVPTFVLMTLVATKLPHYILPIWPALALAVAGIVDAAGRGTLAHGDQRWIRRGAWIAGIGAALIAASVVIVPVWLHAPGLAPWPAAAAFVVLATTGYAIREQARGRLQRACVVLLAGMICFDMVLATGVTPALDRLKPSPPLAAVIRSRTGADVSVVTFGYGEPSLVFYLTGRRVRALPHDSAVAAWAREPGAGVLVTTREVLRHLDLAPLTELVAVRGYNFGSGRWVEVVALSK